MNIRRICALLCAVIISISLCACEKKAQNPSGSQSTASGQSSQTIKTVTLPYSSKDVLNPFTAKTKQNQELSHLLYDPLVKINDVFEPIYFLAQSVEQVDKKLTVALNSATFTDGSPVTADDVVYSLNQARAEGSNYRSKLSNISNCYAADSRSVIIEISHHDPYYVNNLSFPIIKSGTANLKNDNNISVPPIGCGRYIFENGKRPQLTANKSYYRTKIKLSKIELVNCPDADSLSHYLSIGKISAVYSDLSDSVIPKLTGTTSKVLSSSLVYLGINCSKGVLADAKMRLAISFCIDREALCSGSYFDYAEPATSVFHPKWSQINGLKSIDSKQNIELAVAYFEELGYNTLNSEGYRTNNKGEVLKLKLVCNSDNSARVAAANQLQAQLKKCGVAVETVAIDFEQYRGLLETGGYDVYIGEVRLSDSMDLYPIITSGNVVYGIPEQSGARDAFISYCNGESDLLSAVSGFVSEMPFLPLCYRNGVMLADKRVAKALSYSCSDLYNNIENLQ